MKSMMIEYDNLNKTNKPFFDQYKKAFSKILDSGWFILGENVKKFEYEYAQYCGVEYCSGVASGLDALILSIRALDIPEGSEIIVPSNTYIATILSIVQTGNIPILVEPDLCTYNIDPKQIELSITGKTKAIMVVHLYGKVCNMEPIMEICHKHKLYLIEDCAQAHGAKYKGKKAGTFGDLSAFSFYPSKNLGGLGDSGAVLTNNEEYYEKVRILRNYGSNVRYHNIYAGINSRLDEMQAAFLSIKLKALDDINLYKRNLARLYLENLNKQFILPVANDDYYDVYHIFNIRHKKRDKLKEFLLQNGIKTEIHYPVPPNQQKALPFLAGKKFPLSEEIHGTTLSLPISTMHTHKDILRVIQVLNSFN